MSLQYYNDLASNDETVRLEAAHALLSELSLANQPSAASVEYALNRLIRGLASGRESSRIGFSVAFTEVRPTSAASKPVSRHGTKSNRCV